MAASKKKRSASAAKKKTGAKSGASKAKKKKATTTGSPAKKKTNRSPKSAAKKTAKRSTAKPKNKTAKKKTTTGNASAKKTGRRPAAKKAGRRTGGSTPRRQVAAPVQSSSFVERMAAMNAKSADQLEEIMKTSEMPDFMSMQGYMYRGLNIGVMAKLIGVQKFVKGFFFSKEYSEGGVFNFGYNVKTKQDGPGNEWQYKTRKDGEPARFGYYRVYRVDLGERDNKYPNALLLNYGCKINFKLDPTRRLRDYLVRTNPGSDDQLLGKAFLKFGPFRLPAGYFVLDRLEATEYNGDDL